MKGKEAEVVKFLLAHKEQNFNVRTIARGLKMDYKLAYGIITRLESAKVVSIEKFGQSNSIKLVDKINPVIFEAEYLRREDIFKDKNLRAISDYYENGLKTKLYVLILFGSFAKGTQTKKSDIDLMFIVPDSLEEELERKIQNIASTIPLNLHINVFSEKDFLAMKNSKEFTVGQEAIKNNVIIHGIENYYGIIG
jgi:predicted nucleotidyltransferase